MSGPFTALVLVAVALGACSRRADDTKSSAATPSASALASVPTPVNPRAEDIPTEQDFEDEALREVQPAQLEAELERLGKEIQP